MENEQSLKLEVINDLLSDTMQRFNLINEAYFEKQIPGIMLRISDRLYSRIGYAHSNPLGIVLSSRYLEKYGWEVLDEVLKHEIAHIYAYHFYGERGHRGSNFRDACKRMGVSPTARTNELFVDRQKYHYRCRTCGSVYSFFRPLSVVQYCDCGDACDATMLVKANNDQADMPVGEFREKIKPRISVYHCKSCGREIRRYRRWAENHSCAVCHPGVFDRECLMELIKG